MKSALVTGASRGIGKSITVKLLQDGFFVFGVSRTGKYDSELLDHPYFSSLVCDLSDVQQVKTILKPIIESERCPDIIINNAGISEPCAFDVSDEAWETHWKRVMQVNLHTPTNLVKWAIPMWKSRKSGTHIVIASRASYRGETEHYSAYAASKSGIIGVNKTIARAFGPFGIISVGIAPGFTDTDMAREAIPVYGESYIKKDNVLDELMPPEEIAELCVLIAQGKVRHLTGSTIHINSGTYML
jgi:NAD(P)-dependent dehydrogenase (short-subunit alcohol dehydrogenase family)